MSFEPEQKKEQEINDKFDEIMGDCLDRDYWDRLTPIEKERKLLAIKKILEELDN